MSKEIKCIQIDDLCDERFVDSFCNTEMNRFARKARGHALEYVHTSKDEDKQKALGYTVAANEVEEIINNFLLSIRCRSSSSVDGCKNRLEKLMAEQEVKQGLCERCKQTIKEEK